MPRLKIPTFTASLLALAGCAVTATPPRAETNRIDVDSYRLLAEIALAQQRQEDAAENYLNAALASDDPAFAERTALLAYQLGLDTVGHRAVARWREIEPDNPRVDYFAGIFETRSGRVGAAVDDFSVLLGGLKADELGSGLALIVDALSNEPSAGTAAQVMRELTTRFPGTAEGHYGLSQLSLRAGAFGLALQEARAATEAAPEWPEAQLLLARTLLLSGRSEEALGIASELAGEYDNVQVKLQFAELLLSSGETDRAEGLLNEILEQNPGMPEAIRALGFLALAKEDFDVARDQFEMLRSNADFRDESYYYLGRIAELQSDYLQATRAYSRVTEGNRAVDAQIRTSAIMYRQMNDPESALRHLQEFGDANPRFRSEMLLARAQLLLNMDRAEDAIQLIDDAIGDDADVADQSLRDAQIRFYSILMQDAMDKGDLEAASSWIEQGLSRYPDNQDLLYSQARLLQEQGRLRPALRILERLVDESPDDATFLNALGYLLTDRLGRHAEARDYIQRALALDPESGAILDSMGWVLYGLGDYEHALDYLERAYRTLEVPEVMAHLVDVQWALGNHDQALKMLDEALADAPDDPYLTAVRDRLRQ
jgi:tetratricopeptide (TPR) repeat protein